MDNKRPIEPEKARQGKRGSQVFVVLIASLALAAIMWAGVEIYGRVIAPAQPDPQVQTTQ